MFNLNLRWTQWSHRSLPCPFPPKSIRCKQEWKGTCRSRTSETSRQRTVGWCRYWGRSGPISRWATAPMTPPTISLWRQSWRVANQPSTRNGNLPCLPSRVRLPHRKLTGRFLVRESWGRRLRETGARMSLIILSTFPGVLSRQRSVKC